MLKFRWKWLLIIPFAALVYHALRFWLSDTRCQTVWDFFLGIVFVFLLVVTFLISLFAVFPKYEVGRETDKVAASIVGLIVLVFAMGLIFGNRLKGVIWLKAESQNGIRTSFLQLRKNGKAIIEVGEDDISCRSTERYSLSNDTLTLDKNISHDFDYPIAYQYLVKGDSLLPLTVQSRLESGPSLFSFKITERH